MSSAAAQNRFAPPRADVDDQVEVEAHMVEAGRGDRFLAVLIDGVLPAVIGIGIAVAVAVALPAYQRYQQQHVPGIAPPPLGSTHFVSTSWAWLGGFAIIGYFIYSAMLVYLYGQTFGKRLMNIRVVRGDGSRVTFARFIFVRWLPLAVVSFVPVLGGLVSLLDPLLIFRETSLCLHDNIADTRVVTASSSVDATLRGDPKNTSANLRTISF